MILDARVSKNRQGDRFRIVDIKEFGFIGLNATRAGHGVDFPTPVTQARLRVLE
jgi:hypothetical protein